MPAACRGRGRRFLPGVSRGPAETAPARGTPAAPHGGRRRGFISVVSCRERGISGPRHPAIRPETAARTAFFTAWSAHGLWPRAPHRVTLAACPPTSAGTATSAVTAAEEAPHDAAVKPRGESGSHPGLRRRTRRFLPTVSRPAARDSPFLPVRNAGDSGGLGRSGAPEGRFVPRSSRPMRETDARGMPRRPPRVYRERMAGHADEPLGALSSPDVSISPRAFTPSGRHPPPRPPGRAGSRPTTRCPPPPRGPGPRSRRRATG